MSEEEGWREIWAWMRELEGRIQALWWVTIMEAIALIIIGLDIWVWRPQ